MNSQEILKKKFKSNMVVVDFLLDAIERHFPHNQSPKWVDHDSFVCEKMDECLEHLWDAIKCGEKTYNDESLIIGYVSNYLDTGTGRFDSAVDGSSAVHIPDNVQKIYEELHNQIIGGFNG